MDLQQMKLKFCHDPAQYRLYGKMGSLLGAALCVLVFFRGLAFQ